MQKVVIPLLLILFFLSACKKDPKTSEPVSNNNNGFLVTNTIDINITNMAGTTPLALNTQTYINANQDTFSVTLFKYYISNIKLIRQDNFIFIEPNSYRLILQNDTSTCKFSIANVPLGDYTGIEFTIGVDSAKNCSGAQSGALDPVNDMFWDWSQGYIFAKMEGQYKNGSVGNFFHHIGGFSGAFSAIVKSTPSFGSNLIQVTSDKIPKVYMKADVLEWFKNPSIIDLTSYSNVALGKKSSEIAANYSDMFSVAAIQN